MQAVGSAGGAELAGVDARRVLLRAAAPEERRLAAGGGEAAGDDPGTAPSCA